MGTLQPQSSEPLYSSTVIGTLAVDWWTDWLVDWLWLPVPIIG